MVELRKSLLPGLRKIIRPRFRWFRSEMLPLETYLNLNYLIHHTLDSYIHHCYLSDNGTRLECSRPLHAMFSLYFFHWNTHFMVSAHLRFISLSLIVPLREVTTKSAFFITLFLSPALIFFGGALLTFLNLIDICILWHFPNQCQMTVISNTNLKCQNKCV